MPNAHRKVEHGCEEAADVRSAGGERVERDGLPLVGQGQVNP